MNLLYIFTLASSLTILNAAVTSRNEGRRWSRPLIVADEEGQEEPSTDLRAPSRDSIDYYLRPKVQEPRIITSPTGSEDNYEEGQSSSYNLPTKDRPIQFTLSARMNVSNEESRKPQVFPIPKYGSLPKKFQGFKNKPHYLKFYAGDAMKSKNYPSPKQNYDSKSEALVPRVSYVKPTIEVESSEESVEDRSVEKVSEAPRAETRVDPKANAKVDRSAPVKLTDGKQRVEFQMHGHDGPQSYKFGYDTGKGNSRQFRFEERDNDGSVRGHYGFFDEDGKMHVIKYRASADDGFRTDE